MTADQQSPARMSVIGGNLLVKRVGLGTMGLTGPGHWYHPADTGQAITFLRQAVDLGVDHLDTADAYGIEFRRKA